MGKSSKEKKEVSPPADAASDSDDEGELKLDDVLALGGDKEDFELIRSATSSEQPVGATSLVEQLEIKKYLKELGLAGDGSSALIVPDDSIEEETVGPEQHQEEGSESAEKVKPEKKTKKEKKEKSEKTKEQSEKEKLTEKSEKVKLTEKSEKEKEKKKSEKEKERKKSEKEKEKKKSEKEKEKKKSEKEKEKKKSEKEKEKKKSEKEKEKKKSEKEKEKKKSEKEKLKVKSEKKPDVKAETSKSLTVKTEAASSDSSVTAKHSVAREQPVARDAKPAPAVILPPLSKLIPSRPISGYLVKPFSAWLEISGVNGQAASAKNDARLVDIYRQAAQVIYDAEETKYKQAKLSDTSSDANWLKLVMKSGTMADRIAALTLLVQESPVHRLSTLSGLLTMAKNGKRESLLAVNTLTELFLDSLLPEKRRLRSFADRPFGELKDSDPRHQYRQLCLWHAEDCVKREYANLMDALESLLKDSQFEIRQKVLGIVHKLLAERPEQEQTLLRLLINKLGDIERRLASTASHYLLLLVTKHPNMRLVVTTEIERFMYRPNLLERARYYAICFLNQQILSRSDATLANKLIAVYFSYYTKFSGKDSEIDSRMLSALLVGVNRAFPFADLKDDELDAHTSTLHRTVHTSSFNAAIQALMLLFQIMQSRQSVSDRFYCALYAKLLDHQLVVSSKQTLFMNLLFRAMKADPQIVRVKAFMKRLLQVCNMTPPPFVCGALFLISELGFVQPAIRTIIDQPEDADDDEHFEDVPDEDDGEEEEESGMHSQDEAEDVVKDAVRDTTSLVAAGRQYKALHRNPLFSSAEHSCSWEIRQFAQHYHPSVRSFASQVICASRIDYKGDPLQDFTLARFLDRFVFRNPKKRARDHGGSLMQRKEQSHLMSELPVNHTSFWSKKEDKIRPDEIFYHRYFRQLNQMHPHRMKSKDIEDDEFAEVPEEEAGEGDMDFASDMSTSKQELKQQKKKDKQLKKARGGAGSIDDDEGMDDDVSDGEFEKMLAEGGDEDSDVSGSGSDAEPEFDGDLEAAALGDGDFDDQLGDEFNYSDLDEMSDDDGGDGEDSGDDAGAVRSAAGKSAGAPPKKKKKKFTDAEYEKALFEQLSSDEDGTADSAGALGGEMSSMFMAADEFDAMQEKKKMLKKSKAKTPPKEKAKTPPKEKTKPWKKPRKSL